MPKSRLLAQPRIPGVKRVPRHGSLAPEINRVIVRLVASEGKFASGVTAAILGDVIGINADTNEALTPMEHAKRFAALRRAFLTSRWKEED